LLHCLELLRSVFHPCTAHMRGYSLQRITEVFAESLDALDVSQRACMCSFEELDISILICLNHNPNSLPLPLTNRCTPLLPPGPWT
jgi:hypothetical protein